MYRQLVVCFFHRRRSACQVRCFLPRLTAALLTGTSPTQGPCSSYGTCRTYAGRRFNGKTLQCRSIHVCAEPYGDIFNDATRNGVNLRAYSSTGNRTSAMFLIGARRAFSMAVLLLSPSLPITTRRLTSVHPNQLSTGPPPLNRSRM